MAVEAPTVSTQLPAGTRKTVAPSASAPRASPGCHRSPRPCRRRSPRCRRPSCRPAARREDLVVDRQREHEAAGASRRWWGRCRRRPCGVGSSRSPR
jgi:hypothetical protein